MNALVYLLAAVQAAVPATALPPADWATLPELLYRRRAPPVAAVSGFVRGEVEAGRCPTPPSVDADGQSLRVEIAVFVTHGGLIRRVLPRAMGCPTVEQYASGLVSQLARGNVDLGAMPGDQWFRTAMVFSWPR